MTNGGGPGVLATDAIGESRLTVAEFGEDVRRQLEGDLPETTDVGNPLDVLGDADLEHFRTSLDAVLGSDGVGGAIVISVPTPMFEFDELADVIVELQRSHGKPVVTCLMGGDAADRAADTLGASGIPTYFDPARAVPSLEALADYRDVRNREYGSPTTFDVDRERAREILAGAGIDGASGTSGVSDAGGTGDTGTDGSAGNGTTDGHDGGENGDATADEDRTAYLGVEGRPCSASSNIPGIERMAEAIALDYELIAHTGPEVLNRTCGVSKLFLR